MRIRCAVLPSRNFPTALRWRMPITTRSARLLGGQVDDLVRRLVAPHAWRSSCVHPRVGQPALDQLDLLDPRVAGVDEGVTAGGVEHHQPPAAQLRLRDPPVQRGPPLRFGHVPHHDHHRRRSLHEEEGQAEHGVDREQLQPFEPGRVTPLGDLLAMNTARKMAPISNPLNTSAIGNGPTANEASTSTGATNSAICAPDPTAMLIDRSILCAARSTPTPSARPRCPRSPRRSRRRRTATGR